MTSSIRKIAFLSPHCLVDFTNGAATATRDGLQLLAENGFECSAFCGTRLDDPTEGLIQESLFHRKINYEVRKVRIPAPSPRPSVHGGRPLPPLGTAVPSKAGEGRCFDARLIFLVEGKIPVTLFENGSTRGGWFGPQEINAFLAACEIFLRKNRPDVVVTYGGDGVALAAQRLVKLLGIPIVFELHNFAYANRSAFEAVDYVTVPSEFSRRYYREKLGLECHVLPNIVNWKAAQVDKGLGVGGLGLATEKTLQIENCTWKNASLELSEKKAAPRQSESGDESPHSKLGYVTFINPHVVKGVYIFARIARELARQRPDIPILVTQGRSRGDALCNPALGLAPHLLGQFPIAPTCDGRNIITMPFTPDPRSFYPAVYANTRILLMPSLWLESFGLVAAEAMLNGIPVLASSRGALADTVGGSGNVAGTRRVPEADGTRSVPATMCRPGGFLFDIPGKYTPETRVVPSAEEVEPWVETIIRLWDDAAEYERCTRAAREHSQQWHPDRLAPIYREFFSNLSHKTHG